MAASAGPEIERLIALLAKLPGLGPRSARRAALQLLKRREQLLSPLADPFVRQVMEVFPGAELTDIRTLAPPEPAAAANPDDDDEDEDA